MSVPPETKTDDTDTSDDPQQETEDPTGNSRILVLYFSLTGEQYNVAVIDKGNASVVAEMIVEQTGADLFEVLPVDDHYPMTYNALTDVAKKEGITRPDRNTPESLIFRDMIPFLS